MLAAPAAAPAAVTCDYSSAGKLLTVSLSAAGDNAQLAVVGAEITVGRASRRSPVPGRAVRLP